MIECLTLAINSAKVEREDCSSFNVLVFSNVDHLFIKVRNFEANERYRPCYRNKHLPYIFTFRHTHLKNRGAFHSTKNSGNPGLGSEWNRHFLEFHSEILGVPREVGLKFRKIGITGKFHSIRPFLLSPSFSAPGARFLKVPRLFGRISGDIILFVSSKRRCPEARNFADILIFISYTTYEKISFTE